ncbi:GIY-YIG nuclease family protein [Iamia sp. SCSIO 61187]|uniref:GIY-YIG nuclease family protein n=1 Tax=Iamia sp. SCSIO 61187 TaxID=2722752 RepID=UPI001C62B661|nr:GIY-YIG nuclease family protein [Iamia sp. SCSIO 61187]QYG93439.1 GIY-YIG nuclease family protein [Iamia sp. SCSIO 61187]
MGKYDPLHDHLLACNEPVLQMRFTDIERLLGDDLPASARRHPAWWANETVEAHIHARAWLGRRVPNPQCRPQRRHGRVHLGWWNPVTDADAPLGASIRIFLAGGIADGVWVVEKSNWTGKALMAPRTRYRDLRSRSDLDGPGVYLLSGPTESGVPALRIYIGETDDLPGRLDSHNKTKDFWNRVIVFTSKDDNLNKAHIRYLEARLIALAKAANRSELENGNVGSLPPLSEPDTAEAEAFLREMLLIYPVLGLLSFQKAEELPSSSVRLFLRGKDTIAQGTETSEGFVVYAGALGRTVAVPSIHAYGTQIRQAMIEKGVFAVEGKHLRLTEDYVFSSPSNAAMVLQGRTSNGRVEWKAEDGRTLKEIQTEAAGVDEPVGLR